MKIKFIGADVFLDQLIFTQVVYIGGRYGAGKTHLAYLLGCWLLANGHVEKVVSNIDMNIRSKVSVPLQKTAIILDEAWIYLSDRSTVFKYAGYLRKDQDYLLLPAVYPVHRLLMRFTVERILNLYAFGIPAWLYEWRMDRLSVKEKGKFFIFNPARAFGMYDTKAKPRNDGGIVKAIEDTSGVQFDDDQNDEDASIRDALEDVLDSADESTKSINDAVIRLKKIRRR